MHHFRSVCFFVLVACGSGADTVAPEDECPPVDDPCMNEDNYADCLQVAADCDAPVMHLESCPLQFACSE